MTELTQSQQDELEERRYRAQRVRHELKLLTEDELADALEVTTATLASWRGAGQGPDYTKLGRAVYYRVADVVLWAERCVVPIWGQPPYKVPVAASGPYEGPGYTSQGNTAQQVDGGR